VALAARWSQPLADAVASSRAAWPEVELADDDFAAHVAARVDDEIDPGALCLSDLWLACAIQQGDAAALRAFDALTPIEAAIAHLDGGSALADDVRAAVRDRVLGDGAGGNGKISDYRGRGDLRGWLRVVALREALQLLRARRREQPLADELATRLEEGVSPSLTGDELRAYRDAFHAALSTLTARERNLLRQHYLHGATVDELGALYRVHRATAARWIAQIRETLLRRTRRQIGEVLRLTGTELDRAMGRLADHLDLSLRHTLSFEL
jgi:RNA polymerase sigma-70 factor (ECF subfamily)